MKQISTMRRLRRDYRISLRELADAIGVSHQIISDIELGKRPEPWALCLTQRAFAAVIRARDYENARLELDFELCHTHLFDDLEDST